MKQAFISGCGRVFKKNKEADGGFHSLEFAANSKIGKIEYTLLIFAGVIFLSAFALIQTSGQIWVDEVTHYDQVLRFIHGENEINPELTTPPLLHFVLAIPGKFVSAFRSIQAVRSFSFVIGICSIYLFYKICKTQDPIFRTVQFSFLPVLFPFFFLIYTDVPSLELILLSFFFALQKKPHKAAFCAIISIMIRQTNIVWLVFIAAFIFLELQQENRSWKNHLSKLWLFAVGVVLFVVFYWMNSGVPLGDRPAHPLQVSFGNLYLCLFLHFFFFLPVHILNLRKAWNKSQPFLWLLFLIGIFFLFLHTFKVDHYYNQSDEYFLRNKIVLFFSKSIYHKILFFLPIGFCLISLAQMEFKTTAMKYVFYIATVVFLLPQVLIEPRYCIIPFCLFLFFRSQLSKRLEWILAVACILCSMAVLLGMLTQTYFW